MSSYLICQIDANISVKIVRANQDHIADVSHLFDRYRQFYSCEPNLDVATKFVAERISNNESVIFLAIDEGMAQGLVQLYPSFCSVEAIKTFILSDLYVDRCSRKKSVAEKLMTKACQYSREQGAFRINLLTAIDNKSAQHLYEKLGYVRANEDFHAYSLHI